MTVQKILTYPNPILKEISQPVPGDPPETFLKILTDLDDTFKNAPGCVGIAAPQIGWLMRVIILDVQQARKVPESSSIHGKLVCINPEIIAKSGKIYFREGCLSIPDFTGNVSRAEKITVTFLDEHFRAHTCDMTGFEAVIFQHESDHLNGILFLDRVESLKRDVFRRKNYLPPKNSQ